MRHLLATAIAIALVGGGLARSQARAEVPPDTPANPLSIEGAPAPAPVQMACADGQVDLNHATTQEIATLPAPDGRPMSLVVARRIVEGRPYLRVTDVQAPAVEGVTPNHVALWQEMGSVCLSPIFVGATDGTDVPMAPDPCEPGQHDVNDASEDDWFGETFGRPTADRLVSGAPFPSVENALRAAGVGPGSLKKHRAQVCATPYPIAWAGTDWAWSRPTEGIAVDTVGELGTYEVVVPAGTTSGVGAWVSIAEVDSPFDDLADVGLPLELPAADPHVHGDWTGHVAVSLPPDPTNVPAEWPNAVLHWTNGTVEIHGHSAAPTRDDGKIVVSTDDLSIFTVVRFIGSHIPDGVRNYYAFTENLVRGLLGSGGTVRCNPDLTGQTLAGGERMDVSGDLLQPLPMTPPVNYCVERHGEVLDAAFGNGRGYVARVVDTAGVQMHDISAGGSLLWAVIGQALNDHAQETNGTRYLAPGVSFKAHTTPSPTGTVTYATDTAGAILPTTLYLILDELGMFVPVPLVEMVLEFPSCATGFILDFADLASGGSDPLQGLLQLMSSTFECVWSFAQDAADAGTRITAEQWLKPDYKNAWKFKGSVDRVLKVAKIAKVALIVRDLAYQSGANGDITLRYRSPEPPSPQFDDDGRAVFPDCVVKSFSYETGWTNYVDQRCQDLAYGDVDPGPTPPADGPPVNAFDDWDGAITSLRMYNVLRRASDGVLHLILLEAGDLVAHPIAPQDEWSFKQDWPEDEWRSDEFDGLIDRVGPPAINDPLRLRNYTEGRGGNWLLRLENGTTYHVDESGTRRLVGKVESQQALSNTVLTLHPAQYANDVCPYRAEGQTGIIVC